MSRDAATRRVGGARQGEGRGRARSLDDFNQLTTMPAMRTGWMGFWVIAALGAVGCGPSYGGQDAKTPDEIIAEQERLGAEQEKERAANEYTGKVEDTTDEEKKKKWDKKQVDLEMKRAARSAETCPGSVTEKTEKGTAKVTLKFGNDGHVKESTIGSPYEDTAVGKCVLRAMTSVIVPAYEGNEESVEWDIDLTKEPEKKASDKKGAEKKGAAKPKPAAKKEEEKKEEE